MEKENLGFVLIDKDDRILPPKKAVEEERKSFCCRICGSVTYKKVTKSSGILGPGGWTKILYYVCDGCSFHFGNPELASK